MRKNWRRLCERSEESSVREIADATAGMANENRDREGVPKSAMAADFDNRPTEDARRGQRDASLVSARHDSRRS